MVTDLLESEGMIAIVVIVDRFTKMVHFVPYTKDIAMEKYAQLLIDHVLKLHSFHEAIISDHDLGFFSKFWDKLSPISEWICDLVLPSICKLMGRLS